MSISPDDAAAALRDIADTDARSRDLRGYRNGALFLFLWGTIWIIGYGASGLWHHNDLVWLPLVIVGVAASALIARRCKNEGEQGRVGRGALTPLIMAAFIFSMYAVLRPQTPNQYAVLPPLAVALAYAIIGAWVRPRFLWAGAVLFILTLCGYFLFPDIFYFWMAVVGGGVLILTGLWWRNA